MLVVLGAGASHDFVPDRRTKGDLPVDHPYRPPLTQSIFSDSEVTRDLFRLYPGAARLGGSIRVALARGDPLEPFLSELFEATERPRSQQFPEIPLYLQALFSRISENLPDQPVNYQRLADLLFAARWDFERVAFVTLNYDTLLDSVLQQDFLGDIRNMDSYVGERCLLIKLHGSVNWARQIVSVRDILDLPPANKFGENDYLSVLRRLGTQGLQSLLKHGRPSLREPGNRLWAAVDQPQWAQRRVLELFYPALSAPLGEYEPACPKQHLDALEEFLPTCQNVLVIGVSGRDGDLLRLLAEHLQEVGTFCLVDKGASNTESALGNFLGEVPQLGGLAPGVILKYVDGFSEFLLGDGFEQFLSASQ